MNEPQTYPYQRRRITIREASGICGLSCETLRARVKKGMTIEEAMTTPHRWKNSDKRRDAMDSREYRISDYPSIWNNPEVIAICETCPKAECQRGTCKRFRKRAAEIYEKLHREANEDGQTESETDTRVHGIDAQADGEALRLFGDAAGRR